MKLKKLNPEINKQKNSEKEAKADYHLKICLMGWSGVGKTSLINQYLNHSFQELLPLTYVAHSTSIRRELENGETVSIEIWDEGAHDRFSNFGYLYLKQMDAFLFVSDMNKIETFDGLSGYSEYNNESSAAFKVLVLNQNDKENQRLVSPKTAKNFAQAKGMSFYETTATRHDIVEKLFDEVIEAALSYQITKTQQNNEVKKNEISFSEHNPLDNYSHYGKWIGIGAGLLGLSFFAYKLHKGDSDVNADALRLKL